MRTIAGIGACLLLVATAVGCQPAAGPSTSIPRGVWFRSTAVDGNAQVRIHVQSYPVRILFTEQDDGLVRVADGPINGYTVPVTIQGSTIRPDHTRRSATSTVACSAVADPACVVDRWVGTWAERALHVSGSENRLQITHGALVISLRADDALGR